MNKRYPTKVVPLDISKLKVAIFHDSLMEYGGGEKVLETLASLLPQADIFTSALSESALTKVQLQHNQVITPLVNDLYQRAIVRRRILQLLSPWIWRTDTSNYDLVLSHGGFYMSNLIHLCRQPETTTTHIHYSITPPKNLYWSKHQSSWDNLLVSTWHRYLQSLDQKALSRTDMILSVSQDVSKRILDVYGLNNEVLHPPVVEFTQPSSSSAARNNISDGIYLYVGRLEPEKKVELILKTFNYNGLPLVIVGEGSQFKRLKKLAGSNVVLVGFKTERELEYWYSRATAFIHAADGDDFPLAPVEAMARGVPVIAYKSGGLKEQVIEGETGYFFHTATPRSINRAINRLQQLSLDPKRCIRQARQFGTSAFATRFYQLIRRHYVT